MPIVLEIDLTDNNKRGRTRILSINSSFITVIVGGRPFIKCRFSSALRVTIRDFYSKIVAAKG